MSLSAKALTRQNHAGEETKDNQHETLTTTVKTLEPLKSVCAHLHAFHTPFDAPGSTAVPTSHFCAHPTADVRQCLLYESNARDARLLGVEYMITPSLFATLPADEKPLWHTHAFEVKSGMLVMPQAGADAAVPGLREAWERAETAEMRQVVQLYGKVWQTWDPSLPGGSQVPLGRPRLMTSFTRQEQMPDFERVVGERDRELGTDWRRKKELRADIVVPDLSEEADGAWRRKSM